jgi:hypothetical protein
MKIAQAVREASTEQEVYLLLTAYIKGTRLGAEMSSLSQHIRTLPLAGPDDVRGRIEGLFAALGLASKNLDDSSRLALKEALYVFGEALIRLKWIEKRAQRPEGCPGQSNADDALLGSTQLEQTCRSPMR